MIELFQLENVNRAASTFNPEKLLWLNHQYLMNSEPEHVAHHLSPHMGDIGIDPSQGPDLHEVIVAQREKAKTLVELAQISAFYYRDPAEYDEKTANKAYKPEAIEPLSRLRDRLASVADWNREAIHAALEAVVAELEIGFGKIGMPTRLAITGGLPSPELDLTLYLVGREACVRRLDAAIEIIRTQQS